MAEHSEIGWTDATWPIVAGCSYASPGCSNCWAVRDSWRLAHNPNEAVRRAFAGTVKKQADGKLVWTNLVRPLPERLSWPLRWRRGRRIFVCSQADLFHQAVPFEFIAAVFGVAAMVPRHVFQVLTKHPARAAEFFRWIENDADGPLVGCMLHAREKIGVTAWKHEPSDAADYPPWPLPNVWFGVTIEDQQRAEERLPLLLRMQAAVRWISAEPMLEAIDLISIPESNSYFGDVDWLVCGGESAQTRAVTRSFDIGWARDLRDQCEAAGVPFFMKQLGTKPIPQALPGTVMRNPLPLPEGKSSRYKWHEPQYWPEDLRVQQFPT